MNAPRLLRRRARAHAGLLALVLLQVALTTAAVAGATGYVSLAERTGLADSLADAEPRAAALRVAARLSDDPAAQDAAARALLDEHLGALPVTVHGTLASSPLAAVRGAAPDDAATDNADDPAAPADALPAAVLWSGQDLPDAADLVTGTWPTAPDQTALHADAAALTDLAPGDDVTVTVRDTPLTLTITGTWRPRDAEDPRWFADPLPVEGSADDGAVVGPFVVDPATIEGLGGLRYQRWTLVADADRLLPQDLPALRAALDRAVDALGDDPDVDVSGLTAEGGLPTTAAALEARLGGVRGVTTAAVLLVALTGLIALSQMARLLADVRLPETVILRSRGTTVAQVTAASLAEAGLVGVVGATLGASGAVAALSVAGLGTPPLAGTVATAAVAAVLTAGVLAQRAAGHAVGVVRRGRSDAAGRNQRAVRAGGVLVALAAAGLAWWQLDRFGSPVFTGTDGRVHLDPLAAATVALTLLAAALAATALLVPATAVAASGVQRRRDLMPVLTLRELARHTPVHAVTVVLVVLAAGAGTFVGAYGGTLAGWRADVARTAVGADLALDLAAAPTTGLPVADTAARVPGVSAAVPVRTVGLAAGGANGELVAVGPIDLGLPDAVAARLAPADGGPALPDGARELTLDARLAAGLPEDPGLAARVWLTDPTGELVVLEGVPAAAGDATDDAADRTQDLAWTAGVPEGDWAVAAVDLTLATLPPTPELVAAYAWISAQTDQRVVNAWEPPAEERVRLEVTALAADGADLLAAGGDWAAYSPSGADAVRHDTVGAGVVLERDVAEATLGTPLRLLPEGLADAAAAPLPVVVPAGWRASYDVDLGGRTTMRVAGLEVPVLVVGEVAVVPGSAAAAEQVVPGTVPQGPRGPGASADATALAALTDVRSLLPLLLTARTEVPAPDAVWLAAADPDDVAGAAADAVATRGGPDAPRRVTDRTTADPGTDRLSAPAVVATWLAAACALLVMVPGVASTALALALARRREAAVLRALGVGPRQQARARRAELALVAGSAVVAGVAAGLLAAWLCAGALVRATAPGPAALPVRLAPDVAGSAAAVAAAVVLLALVVVGYGASVAAQVRAATRVEEER